MAKCSFGTASHDLLDTRQRVGRSEHDSKMKQSRVDDEGVCECRLYWDTPGGLMPSVHRSDLHSISAQSLSNTRAGGNVETEESAQLLIDIQQ